MRSEYWRVLHWGPITLLGMIATVLISTVTSSSILWPPGQSLFGLLYPVFNAFFLSLTLYFSTISLIMGPGYIKLRWTPGDRAAETQLQFCDRCQGYKAPRSHHCRQCDRCVMKMDHHCPLINTCVGHKNQGPFLVFIFNGVTACVMGTISNGLVLYYCIIDESVKLSHTDFFIVSGGLGLSLAISLGVGYLLITQIRAIVYNQTSVEAKIRRRADTRLRETGETFVWPYDMGRWENFKQVMRHFPCVPAGNGVEWEVVSGCDQFTLSREEIIQKRENKKTQSRDSEILWRGIVFCIIFVMSFAISFKLQMNPEPLEYDDF